MAAPTNAALASRVDRCEALMADILDALVVGHEVGRDERAELRALKESAGWQKRADSLEAVR